MAKGGVAWAGAGAGARPSYWPSGASIICNYGVRETERQRGRERRRAQSRRPVKHLEKCRR